MSTKSPRHHALEGVTPLPPEVIARYRKQGALPSISLGQALHEAALRCASNVALVTPDTRLSYRELDGISDKVAALLLNMGLQPGDRAMFQIGNVAEIFYLLYGCFKSGVVPVCTLAAHRQSEIGCLADMAAAKAHFIQADLPKFDALAFALEMREKVPSLEHILAVRMTVEHQQDDGVVCLESSLEQIDAKSARRAIEALDIGPDDVVAFQLSGGTTGIPKIIPRFHAEYMHNSECYGACARYTQDSVGYWPLPAIHNAAMVQFNLPIHLTGGTVVVQMSHKTEDFLGMIEREKVTHSGAALPLIVRAVESGAIDDFDLSSVIDFVSLGEGELVSKGMRLPSNHIFGMAEGLCMRTRMEDPDEVRSGMIGRPISPFDEVRIVDPETGEELPLGDTGEFWARGPYTTRGYYQAAAHNSEKFSAEGFYKSGDLMRAHQIGGEVYYSFEGRLKDNIDRGMEKINAEELERAIIEHENVREVFCVGMPDREYGEKVCAYIIPVNRAQGPSLPLLGSFLQSQGVAKFKWPERIELVETFPSTKVGKTSKALLVQDVTNKLVQEGQLDASYLTG